MKKYTDIVVRYDPATNIVSIRPADGSSLPEEFSTFHVNKIDTLELVNCIGESIVAYLNSVHFGAFIDEEAQSQFATNESASETFMMARRMIAEIGDASSVADIAAIESLLERVSKAGDKAASNYLDGPWRPLKSVLLRRIGRRDV